MNTSVRHHVRKTAHGYCSVRHHYRRVPGLKDYAGMNREAAKAMGYHPLPRKDEPVVNQSLNRFDTKKTVVHERVEEGLMRSGWPYWKAHNAALRAENAPGIENYKEHARLLPDAAFDKTQLKKGTKVEGEHTANKALAKEISKDHLLETPSYYTKLDKAKL